MKIAMGQLLVEGTEPLRNLERAGKMIALAAGKNADLIILPETMDFAWTHPDALNESQPIPSKYSRFFCDLAIKFNIWICVGLTEKTAQGNYNSALLINRQGEIIGKHRKINLLEVEFPYYLVGQSLNVYDTEFGKIGLNICADNYIDSLSIGHTLAQMGAQLILSPSSWTVDHHITEEDEPYHEKWVKPLSVLASTYDLTVVSTTSVGYIVGGPYEGKKMVGRSIAIDASGIIAEGEYNEFAGDLKVFDVELKPHTIKGTQIGAHLKNKGIKFY
jgi:predicted amidohydrolase